MTGTAGSSPTTRGKTSRGFEPPPRVSERDRLDLWNGIAELRRDIVVEGQHLGSVFVRSDTRELMAVITESIWIAIGVMGIACVIAWLGVARLRGQIAVPLTALAEGSDAMARGDLSTRVQVESDDEIGAVANSFNGMAQSLRGLVAQVGENTLAVSEAALVLQAASDGMHEVARKQECAVEGSSESIEKMSASIDEVNRSVESLSETARETATGAVQMDSSIVEIGSQMDDLSHNMDTVASSVVEMTTAIREIAEHAETLDTATESASSSLQQLSSSVAQVERNAKLSQELSNQASEQAERGMGSVDETVDGMKQIQVSFNGLELIISRLDEQSQSIGDVLNVIGGVVEQTNLLALNAAIISSHAGEHGRAFSVVAEEVKNLSDRTAGSTKEIGELIQGVQREVANAVKAVSDGGGLVESGVSLSLVAGEALKKMAESAAESSRNADEIVHATGEQARGLQRVDEAMLQVKRISLELNRGTHEQDSARAEITRGVERLRDVGQNVKIFTHEQRKGSRHIAESVEFVVDRIEQILGATKEQSKQGTLILEALKVFREVTVESAQQAEDMKQTVELISERADALDQEVGRFSI